MPEEAATPKNELALCRLWQTYQPPRDGLKTTDGRALRVVYRGRWSHGFGPDFQDAMLVFDDGPLLSGDIEVHRRAADWHAHGHEQDERYGRVILHLTWEAAAVVCRRRDGQEVPQLALRPYLPPATTVETEPGPALGALGDAPCAAGLVREAPAALRQIVRGAGLARLRAKAATIEADLAVVSPEQAFYRGLLDALGYSQNRAPFGALADLLPIAALDGFCAGQPTARARNRLAALLLGAAGFWPWRDWAGLRLGAALTAAIAADWARLGDPWRPPEPLDWRLARLRPANHPARRLLGLAHLLAPGPADLADEAVALTRAAADTPRRLVQRLQARLAAADGADGEATTLIGPDRAGEIVVNVVVPHALARAAIGGDAALAAAAVAVAERLRPGGGNAHARAMLDQLGGGDRLPIASALEEQGLLHLYHAWCRARRCHECPVAAATGLRLARLAPPPADGG
jgi:hypothetical protein